MFLYLIFQYLSIFLPNFISFEKTDLEVIQIARMAIFMIVTLIFLVEHGLISRPNDASGGLHVFYSFLQLTVESRDLSQPEKRKTVK